LDRTGNHLAQGFYNALEELDNTDPVALAKARELRDVIAELEALFLAYRSQLLKALEEAAEEEAAEEEEGDEDEDEGSAQASCRFAYEAAIDAIAGLREKAEVARVGDPTRAVRSRSKRQVTAGEKVAEGIEEEALAIKVAAEEAWAAAAALDEAKAEYGQLNEGTGTGSSWALSLTCGAFSSDTQLFSLPSGKKASGCHFRGDLWTT